MRVSVGRGRWSFRFGAKSALIKPSAAIVEELPGTTAGKRGLVGARRREATNNSNSTTSNSITRCILVAFDELRAVVSERESPRASPPSRKASAWSTMVDHGRPDSVLSGRSPRREEQRGRNVLRVPTKPALFYDGIHGSKCTRRRSHFRLATERSGWRASSAASSSFFCLPRPPRSSSSRRCRWWCVMESACSSRSLPLVAVEWWRWWCW